MSMEKEEESLPESTTELSRFLQKNPDIFPKKVQDYLLLRGPKRRADRPEDELSFFAYYFAISPSTRHEAHWQFQSMVLWEIHETLSEIRDFLKQSKNIKIKENKKAVEITAKAITADTNIGRKERKQLE